MKAKLAYYKGDGDWTDKLIRWFTGSPYSHVELVVVATWYSSSPRTMRVAARTITPREGHWDYQDVEVDIDVLDEFYRRTMDTKYDWLGILGEVTGLPIHSKDKYYCSEWCAEAIGREETLVNPGKLYRQIEMESK